MIQMRATYMPDAYTPGHYISPPDARILYIPPFCYARAMPLACGEGLKPLCMYTTPSIKIDTTMTR